MSSKRKQFKAADIVAFWYPLFAGKFDDEEDMARSCFRCGYDHGLQKAHIVALADGGPDEIENIHLLCRPCHQATEGIAVRLGRAFYDSSLQMSTTDGFTFHLLRLGLYRVPDGGAALFDSMFAAGAFAGSEWERSASTLAANRARAVRS